MPGMERPISSQEQSFNQVTMRPRQNAIEPNELDSKNKEKLLNKLTGRKDPSVFDKPDRTKMDKDGFLKLLAHQMQNQDPMNPMEQGQLGGELAQYSQLEQLSNLNSKFDLLTKNGNTQDQFYGASFLGKEVVTNGSTLKINENGAPGDILFNLNKDASKLMVRVFDQNNMMVGELWRDNVSRGNQKINWDGIHLDGTPSIKGNYKLQVSAWDKDSDPIKVDTKVTGIVKSVYFEDGETILEVDGKKVFLRDIDSFHMPNTLQEKVVVDEAANGKKEMNLSLDKALESQKQKANRAYKQHIPTTGISDIY